MEGWRGGDGGEDGGGGGGGEGRGDMALGRINVGVYCTCGARPRRCDVRVVRKGGGRGQGGWELHQRHGRL